MNTNSVWEFLSSISVGTIVAWVTVICAIIGAIGCATIKLYNIFTKYKEVEDEKEELRTLVQEHEEKLKEVDMVLAEINKNINEQFLVINEKLEEQRGTKIKELRHSIVRAGEEAVGAKSLTIRAWKSLHEMFDEYTEKYHQNSYVESLMQKVDECEIIGRLNEHGQDID